MSYEGQPQVDLAAGLVALSNAGAWPSGTVWRVRDLCIFQAAELSLVLACDSNASIGSKPNDFLQKDPEEVGYSAAKVPLMEVLAAGAAPFVVVDNLCCELDPYGRALLAGVKRAVEEAGEGIAVTGSDETNMPTVQTGLGVTVLGVARRGELLLGQAQRGDAVVCVGVPKDGAAVPYQEGDPDIASVRHVRAALASQLAHELLPVGSRGVAHEAGELARTVGLASHLISSAVDMEISAGAGTCFLAAVPPGCVDALGHSTGIAVTVVGSLGPVGE
jgi:AIR synthase related protein, N-terminal domain